MNCTFFKGDPSGIAEAARLIRGGGVVAFPTETFYGLGADAWNEQALEKIFRIKGRDFRKPLLLLIAHRNWLAELVKEISPLAERLMENFWPGPLTLVLPASPRLPPAVTAGTGKVGLRISSHLLSQALVEAAGKPVTGTSANLSGRDPATWPEEVCRVLGGGIDGVLDGGQTAGGLGSTVVEVTGAPRILRAGAIPREVLLPWFTEEGQG